MCGRRGNSSMLQALFLLGLIGSLAYCFLLYNSTVLQLEQSNGQNERSMRQRESLAAQLQVVYEHRARLEKSLQKEKIDHKNTQQEQMIEQQDFLLNVTRTKHEHMNRFNSLDTSYKMLKAQYDQLQTEYNRLQQQHARVSSEHTTLYERLSQNLQALKIQKRNEISGLEAEIDTLQQQTETLRTRAKQYMSVANQYKEQRSRLFKENDENKKVITLLRQDLANQKELLGRCTKNLEMSRREAEKHQAKESNTKRTQLDRQPVAHKDSPISDRKIVKKIEEKQNEDVHGKESRTTKYQHSESARRANRDQQVAEQSRVVHHPIAAVGARQGNDVQRNTTHYSRDEQGRRPQSSKIQAQPHPVDTMRTLGQSELDVPLKDRGDQAVQVVKKDNVNNEDQGPERRHRDLYGKRDKDRIGTSPSQEQYNEPNGNKKVRKDPDVYDKDSDEEQNNNNEERNNKAEEQNNKDEEQTNDGEEQTNNDEDDGDNFEDAVDDKFPQTMGAERNMDDESYSRENRKAHEDFNKKDNLKYTSQGKGEPELIKQSNEQSTGEALHHKDARPDSKDEEKVEAEYDDDDDDGNDDGNDDDNDDVPGDDNVPRGVRPIQGASKEAQSQRRTFE